MKCCKAFVEEYFEGLLKIVLKSCCDKWSWAFIMLNRTLTCLISFFCRWSSENKPLNSTWCCSWQGMFCWIFATKGNIAWPRNLCKRLCNDATDMRERWQMRVLLLWLKNGVLFKRKYVVGRLETDI